MSLLFYLHYLAQVVPKSELEDINQLPTQFREDNISNGFTIAFGIAGGIALIVVTYGGLKYVLSQGNPQETAKAKNVIVDGLIGLAVIVAAGGIIGFVVSVLR